jgi:acetyl-CoA synthetase
MQNKIGNILRSFGVNKGDSVSIYLPSSPIAVASMLACARIGALHSVVFAGFSSESLASRINDGNFYSSLSLSLKLFNILINLKAKCKVILTSNQGMRGGKPIELLKTVNAAVEKCPTIKNVFITKRTDLKFETNEKYIDLDLVTSFILSFLND